MKKISHNNLFLNELNFSKENYEKILIQLKCIEISHNKDSISYIILYRKCVIQKIIHPSE